LQLVTADAELAEALREAEPDLVSITRAREVAVRNALEGDPPEVQVAAALRVAVVR
jgi:hypothetical protein